jgi:hypothetical protein
MIVRKEGLLRIGLAALAATLIGTRGARAQTEVDLELVLAVDISRSMDFSEAVTQRRGYIEAFLHQDVIEAIQSGLLGQIAVTYMEWSGPGLQTVVVPWMIIDGPAAGERFGEILSAAPVYRWQATSISDALLFGASLFTDSGFTGTRKVIDISGDGPNNMGLPVLLARQMVLEREIVINGLPIMINEEDPFRGLANVGLDVYYEDCVIGGLGAFIVAVDDPSNFAEAIRRKMVLEIASAPMLPPLEAPIAATPAQSDPPRIDCLVGERVRGFFGP